MSDMKVRAAVFRGPRQPLSMETLLLSPPGAGEVLVRMVAAGVCHSDLHVVDGEWSRPADVVLGHEGAGVVEALGPQVGGLAVGDLVVLAWTAPCAACPACRRGEPWLCAEPRGSGHRLSPAQARLRDHDGSPVGAYSGIGTFAERQVVAAEAAIRVDPSTPPEIAALVGCAVTTGVGAVVNTAGVRAGESVVVIGAGGVGLSATMAAVMAGARPVVAIDAVSDKLALAHEAGATHTATPAEAPALVAQLTERGADHVFEAIGRSTTVEVAIDLTRPGGTTTLVGMTPQGDRAAIDVYRFVEEGKRLLGSNYGSAVPARDFPRICDLYRDGRLPLDLLITQRISLDDLEVAFAAMRRRDGARRVVVF